MTLTQDKAIYKIINYGKACYQKNYFVCLNDYHL